MSEPKLGKSKKGLTMHYSVGAIIKKNDKFLLIDRAKFPFGFACLAGHIDGGETPVEALKREVAEESGLMISSYKLIAEEELDFNTCGKGVSVHYFYVYECETEGKVEQNKIESKSIGWYTKEEIKELKLEPVWEYWFKKLGVI